MVDAGAGFEGSVMFIIWTERSCLAVTRAKVDVPIFTVAISDGPSSPG